MLQHKMNVSSSPVRKWENIPSFKKIKQKIEKSPEIKFNKQNGVNQKVFPTLESHKCEKEKSQIVFFQELFCMNGV